MPRASGELRVEIAREEKYTHRNLAESRRPIAFICEVISKARSFATNPGIWYDIPTNVRKLEIRSN